MLVINLSGLTFCNIGVGLAVVKPAVDASRPRHGLQRPAATWGKGSPWPGPAGCRERLLRRAASRVWGVFCEDFFLPVRPPSLQARFSADQQGNEEKARSPELKDVQLEARRPGASKGAQAAARPTTLGSLPVSPGGGSGPAPGEAQNTASGGQGTTPGSVAAASGGRSRSRTCSAGREGCGRGQVSVRWHLVLTHTCGSTCARPAPQGQTGPGTPESGPRRPAGMVEA